MPVTNRKTADAASALMHTHGQLAGVEAASRAETSRDRGNIFTFCHWRQVERVIVSLSVEQVQGTVH